MSSEPNPRFFSAEDCQAFLARTRGFARGGGETTVLIDSRWSGNLRWARNRILSSGDTRDNPFTVVRAHNGAFGTATNNVVDGIALQETVQRAERWMEFRRESMQNQWLIAGNFFESYLHPKLWFDTTFQQDAAARADAMHRLVQPAIRAGVLAAGYLQVSATGTSSMDQDHFWYYPYTTAQLTMTVRWPDGSGSGWAGVDWNDWSRIDAEQLAQTALDKCLRSRNPVRLEPGRYTTILEPQAVGDLVNRLFSRAALDRTWAEFGDPTPLTQSPYYRPNSQSPFNAGSGISKLGLKVIDERLSVSTDPMDPNLGFPPFSGWQVYHPVTWIQDGILQELAYFRPYAVKKLGLDTGGKPQYGDRDTGAFHMSVRGETATIDEMIATTKRGVLVTRFSNVSDPIDIKSLLLAGYTRDGLWLIENGKISKAIKNFRFTESPVFALNNVEQIGVPQRIFHPVYPIVVPALKVRDFSFTSLSEAI